MKKTMIVLTLILGMLQLSVSAEDFQQTFEIEVTDETVNAVILTVLKPNSLGISNFEDLAPDNIGEVVYTYQFYERPSREVETVQFHLGIPEDQPRGTYKVRVTFVNDVEENTVSVLYDDIELMSDEDIMRLYEADSGEIVSILDEFVTVEGFFPLEELDTVKATENYGEYYTAARDTYFSSGYTNAVNDIQDNVRIALLAESLLTQNENMIDERLLTYTNLSERFGFQDYEKLSEEQREAVLKDYQARTDLNEYDIATAIIEFRNSIGLTIFNVGTSAQKEQALLDYRDDIGIEEISDENQREGIIRYLTGTFDTWEALKNAVNVANEAYQEQNISNNNSSSPNRGSGGNGGGVGGRGTVAVIEQPTASPKPSEQPLQPIVFDDLDGYDWAKEDIIELYNKNVVNGVGGSFYPASMITRAEFCKLVATAFELESTTVSEPFLDVKHSQWHYPYIMAAYQAGIVNGVSETEFWPDAPITRQDLAAILFRLPAIHNTMTASTASFTDEASIADYAKEAVTALSGAGILTGYEDGSFQGQDTATRAESAVIICRLLRYLEGLQG